MASFGLSEGAPWGSEGSRSRRKRPYFSPSPPHEEEEEEEEEEGRRGRLRPGCWDPQRGGGGWSRSPPRRKRERRRSGGSSSGVPAWRSPDPRQPRAPSPSPSSGGSRERGRSRRRERGSPRAESPHGSPWEPAPKRTPRWRSPGREGEDALGRRRMMMGGSPTQRSSSRSSSSYRSKGVPGWEARQDQDHREREAYPRREGRSGERRRASDQREGSYGEEEGVWEKPSSSRSKGVPGWEARQDQDHREREVYPRKQAGSGERQSSFYQREGSYDGREGGQSSSRSKGVPGWEARQDRDHWEREAYPKKGVQRGSDEREGSHGEWVGGRARPSSSRSTRRSGWEARQDQGHQEREAYPKTEAKSRERQKGPESTEGGFPRYARGEGGWSSPSRRREQGGPSWKESQEDSPNYRDQSHFDSDLRGSTWDSPELKRREYERPTTSGKGREIRHRSSEDLEDWGSSTGYLEEQGVEEALKIPGDQGGSAGPEGRPKIYMGPDKRAVAPKMWAPRGEVVDFWNQCQSLMHIDVKNYLLSTCPRPTLPDKSSETPVLNPSIMALMTSKQRQQYMASSYYLRLIHEEVLNMLGPVMTVYEMAEESIEKREAVDPLELREWSHRIVRYMGSLNQRLKLQCCSHILTMIDPRLKRKTTQLSAWSADGLLFAEDKVKLLQDLIQRGQFFEENQTRDINTRNDGDRKRGSEKFTSHAREDAAELNEQISAPQSFAAVARRVQREKAVSLELWHRRFGHQDEKAILGLQNRHVAVGVRINQADAWSSAKCAVCLKVKGAKLPPVARMGRASTQVLDLIHGVLHGPLPVPSVKNQRYVLIFVDDYSRYCVSFLLKEQKEVRKMLTKYITSMTGYFQRKPKAFEMEQVAASLSRRLEAFLEEQGVLYRVQGHPTPKKNGTAVWEMRTLFEMTRCMLADAALPGRFWGDAFLMATHLLNRLPAEGGSKTPFELWHGRVPQMNHLRVFGSLAYAETFQWDRRKMGSSTEKTVLLGYFPGHKRYNVMNLETGEVKKQRVLYFVEEKGASPKWTASDPVGAQESSVDSLLGAAASAPPRLGSDRTQEEDGTEPWTPGEDDGGGDGEPDPLEEALASREAPEPAVRRASQPDSSASPPRIHSPASPLPRTEPGTREGVELYRAGVVNQGCLPNRGDDSDQTFAPVLQHSTLRMLLSIAASKQMQVKHLEVKTALRLGEIAEEPCARQAAPARNGKLQKVLLEEGFRQDRADPCLYNRSRNGHLSFIFNYADDLVVATQREEEYAEIVQRLSDEVEIQELGDAAHYLDTQMKREGDGSCSP